MIGVGIETPNGIVVETLVSAGFPVFVINPKQLDRFRDRFAMSGAKDDRRDARVIADSLRTDRRSYGLLEPEADAVQPQAVFIEPGGRAGAADQDHGIHPFGIGDDAQP